MNLPLKDFTVTVTYLKLDRDVPGRVTVTGRSCLRYGHGTDGTVRYGHFNGRLTVKGNLSNMLSNNVSIKDEKKKEYLMP